MITDEMTARGHKVSVLSPNSNFVETKYLSRVKKWLGYIDQYIVFPKQIRRFIKKQPSDTLYVFTDHAQGPWVHTVANKKHIIHCHDFLAQNSALGHIRENPTSITGRLYQKLIFNGYSKGNNFVSVSKKTQEDLHEILSKTDYISNVVYNSIDSSFNFVDTKTAKLKLKKRLSVNIDSGYILHLGGNQWYKNRLGVIQIYDAWRDKYKQVLPLLLVGQYPTGAILDAYLNSSYKDDIHLLSKVNDETLNLLYSAASVFIFPSLAEGFGWPIAEAMACRCAVITTDEAPMTEVAGDAAFLIPKRPINRDEIKQWITSSADVLDKVLHVDEAQHSKIIHQGLEQVKKFERNKIMNQIEALYLEASK